MRFMQDKAQRRTPGSAAREPEQPRVPAYLQPLAFVSSGVIQPDLEDEVATAGIAAGLGVPHPDFGAEPATTSTAAGLGSLQPAAAAAAAAAAALGFEAASIGGASDGAGLGDEATTEAAAISAADIPDHPGLGFAPPAAVQPSCSMGSQPDPPEPDAAHAGLGYDSAAAAQLSGGSEQVSGPMYQDAAAQPSANRLPQAGLSGHDTWARGEATAGRGMPAGDAAVVAEQLASSLAAWAERHVDAAGAAEFEQIAGVPLHTALLRGLTR